MVSARSSRFSGALKRWSASFTRVRRMSGPSAWPSRRSATSTGHVAVGGAVQQPDRERQLERLAQHQVASSVLDQPPGDRIGFLVVLARRAGPRPWPSPSCARCPAVEPGPHRVLGEVRGRGDADEPGDPRRRAPGEEAARSSRPCSSRRAPAALRSAAGSRRARPAPSRRCRRPGIPPGGAVPGVVEAEEAPALRPRPGLEELRLGAGHVRVEAAEEDHARPPARAQAIGDAAAVRQLAACRASMGLS